MGRGSPTHSPYKPNYHPTFNLVAFSYQISQWFSHPGPHWPNMTLFFLLLINKLENDFGCNFVHPLWSLKAETNHIIFVRVVREQCVSCRVYVCLLFPKSILIGYSQRNLSLIHHYFVSILIFYFPRVNKSYTVVFTAKSL